MSGISVLVLTKNEEQDLPGCLRSLAWSDDIVVYDSVSDDRTVEIARQFGARVVQRPFDNWSAHQNWGLRNIDFKHRWVYYSDADERVTPELASAMQRAVAQAGDAVAFRVRRRDHFLGAWLRHVAPSPFNIRLFRPDRIRYERLCNPVTLVDGPTRDIAEHFDHFPFSKGIAHWYDKHNRYSTFEAEQILLNQANGTQFSLWRAFFDSDRNERRFHQKEFYYRLPLRPVVMFLLLYLVRGGILDGRAGLTYSLLRAFYEYMIVLKVREAKQKPVEAVERVPEGTTEQV
ncbi:glycosyltransferase family 2 protein [Cupriavidus agavae]|uniref:Glycosyltransferase involved in cell wall biosynthesis n=1 Tax=Cupriavidus agavae TaxID=1001822 RepID=A0A4Q7RF68_9BURK|nr:glycosyltransferase family 2 protein [Cupriavidus agavae]RZT31845.1 glycosyltransferase involved in cell wall biosynthesis [Cupriavidus agavae]